MRDVLDFTSREAVGTTADLITEFHHLRVEFTFEKVCAAESVDAAELLIRRRLFCKYLQFLYKMETLLFFNNQDLSFSDIELQFMYFEQQNTAENHLLITPYNIS